MKGTVGGVRRQPRESGGARIEVRLERCAGRDIRGFGLLEAVLTVVITAILGSISYVGYSAITASLPDKMGVAFALELERKANYGRQFEWSSAEIVGSFGADGVRGGGDDTGLHADLPEGSEITVIEDTSTGDISVVIGAYEGFIEVQIPGAAEQYVTAHYVGSDGLPQNSVTDVVNSYTSHAAAMEATNCEMPNLTHALVLFGAETGDTLDARFQTYGHNSNFGLRGMQVDGTARMQGLNAPRVTVNGASTITGGSPYGSNVNWIGGLETGDFDYEKELWEAWAAMVASGNRVVIVDNTSGPTYISSLSGKERPNPSERIIFVAPGEFDVTIERSAYGRQFGDSLVAPSAHVRVRGGIGNVDGVVVSESLSHYGSNANGDVLHGGTVSGIQFSCK